MTTPKVEPWTVEDVSLWQYQDRDGHWQPFIDAAHLRNTIKDGNWPIRSLVPADAYAAQQAALEEAVGLLEAFVARRGLDGLPEIDAAIAFLAKHKG